MQADIKRAELMIQNLIHDKEALKTALSSAVRKKEELFKIVLEYKAALEKLSAKTSEVEYRLDEVGLVKNEIDKVKQQLLRRDDKIKALSKRNSVLEQLLEEQGITSNLWKGMYKKSQSMEKHNPNSIEIAVEVMLRKVKINADFHRLFKNCVPCTSYFKELVENEKYEEALVKVCKFAGELMKDDEKFRFRDLSPGVSEIQQSMTSFYTTSQRCEDEDDEVRINKLKQEIQTNMASSKEVLLSKNISTSMRTPKATDTSCTPSEKRPESPKKINSLSRTQIKIIRRPGSKSAKALPKPSILKRTE